VVALLLLVAALPAVGRAADAERVADEVIATCRARGDRLHLASALNNQRVLHIARKDGRAAVAGQLAFLQLGRELGVPVIEYYGQYNLGELYYCFGELDQAEGHARRARALEARHPELAPRPVSLLLLGRIAVLRGELAQARSLLAEARQHHRLAIDGDEPAARFSPSEDVLLELLDLSTRAATAAEWDALLDRSARDSAEQEVLEVPELRGLAAARQGDLADARRWYERALSLAEALPSLLEPRLRRGLAQSSPNEASSPTARPTSDSPAIAPPATIAADSSLEDKRRPRSPSSAPAQIATP
jgi:tetratricopeptide (TPR) repeat protein